MNIYINGTPSEKQAEFFSAKTRYIAYGGSRGGGKSWALRRKLVCLCLRYPGINCLIVRRTYSELKANHLHTLSSEYGQLFDYSDSDKILRFKNGSTVSLGYCDAERDTLRYQGQEYDIIAIDEATQLTEHQFSIFKACLRGTRPFPRRLYLTCNPGGIGHAWVKRLFIDRIFREGENPDDYTFIPASVYDNDTLTANDPEYIKSLESLPPKLRRAWLDGEWDVFEGQFFPEFSETKHVIPREAVPGELTYFAAADYGFDMFVLLLMGVAADGTLYAVEEFAEKNLTLGEAGKRAEAVLGDYPVRYLVISPDIYNRRQDSGVSGIETFTANRKLPPVTPADNRRVPGWRILRERLARETEGKPSLLISESCKTLIRSLPFLIFDSSRPEDASDQPHEYTHAPEALRYGVMSRILYETPPEKPIWNFKKNSEWGAW